MLPCYPPLPSFLPSFLPAFLLPFRVWLSFRNEYISSDCLNTVHARTHAHTHTAHPYSHLCTVQGELAFTGLVSRNAVHTSARNDGANPFREQPVRDCTGSAHVVIQSRISHLGVAGKRDHRTSNVNTRRSSASAYTEIHSYR